MRDQDVDLDFHGHSRDPFRLKWLVDDSLDEYFDVDWDVRVDHIGPEERQEVHVDQPGPEERQEVGACPTFAGAPS